MPIAPGVNSCGADTNAEGIYDRLVDEDDFEFPEIDFDESQFQIPPESGPVYEEVNKVTLDQLTSRTLGGDGVFDALMEVTHLHLEKEFKAQRITGREYADVYTASIQAAMGQAVSFLMSKDNAYWQAIMAQAQARTALIEIVTARVNLENTKLEYITRKANAKGAAADYALKKMQLSIADAEYCIKLLEKEALTANIEYKVYQNQNILPLQRDQLSLGNEQIEATIQGILKDVEMKTFQITDMFPLEKATAESNMLSAAIDRDMKQYQMDYVLPAQRLLTEEQAETARAQTLGNRSDGTPVAGIIGWDNRLKEFNYSNVLPQQLELVREQVEVQRAQTMDTRRDGTTIEGSVGKQKDLYDQQIVSYQRDAEVKAAKMFIDSWLAQKAIDEGLTAPPALVNDSVNTVMQRIKTNNGLNT